MSEHSHAQHGELSELEARVLAIESLLREKGLIEGEEVDEIVYRYEHDIGPMLGARVVARAWNDPDFKARLLADGTSAIREMGIEAPDLELVVVPNRPRLHNLIVCTLCSCYPWFVLGLPPVWYKSAPYRSRAVIEPREVLREFGLVIDDDTEVRVWDSSAEMRYMVLPERPPGTESWNEDQLASLVTRDCMIGTARPAVPEAVRA
jgi:nitrile hydratase